MHQFLSSVLSFVLSPFNWIVVLLIAAWLLKKRKVKKVLIIISLCLFVIFGNAFLLNLSVKNYQPARVSIDTLPVYSCGIVPGGFASVDDEATGYFNSSSDRFIQAVKLFKLKKITHLLISGGNGKTDDADFKEAAWVKNELVQFGVPDSLIFIEDLSNNTRDNALNSKRILDSLQLQPPYLLITSALHIPRASFLFTNAGVPVINFPCNYTSGLGPFSAADLIPLPSQLPDWDKFLKEVFGNFYYKYVVQG